MARTEIERIGQSTRSMVPGVSDEDWELMSEEDRMKLAAPAHPQEDFKDKQYRKKHGKFMNGELGA
jgi:hypothetical protein